MLKAKYDEEIANLKGVVDLPWHSREFYAAWLTQTYHYSQKVTRILLMGAAHAKLDATKLHRRLAVHSGEEKGHELLAERDLKDLGLTLESIGEFPVTRGFYATQYFTIQNVSSESLYGWILPLEGLALHYGKEIAAKVKQNPNFPSRFWDVHIDEDPGHVDSAFQIVNQFTPEHHEQIVRNMRFTVDMYYKIMGECVAYAKRAEKKKAS